MIRATLLALSLTLPLAHSALAQSRADPEAASGWAPKPLVEARSEMIVAAHPEASAAGAAILAEGGSAADAAIAALLVLNVVEPQSSGIGGGAFALVHGPGGLTSLDARETAPMAAGPDLFFVDGEKLGWTAAVPTGRSVGVPGLVQLMGQMHARHGRLPWARLFVPAIRLAEEGFTVSPRLAASVARFAEQIAGTDAARVFLPGGKPLSEGSTWRNPDLARSLRRLALSGPRLFYEGAMAGEIVKAVEATPMPGALTLGDFAAYEVVERKPVCLPYRAYRICGMGPPSSGATTVGQILGLMEAVGVPQDAATRHHLFAEASRLAYADRALYLGDPDQVKVPVRGLLDPAYLAERASLIDPGQASPDVAEAGDPPWHEGRFAPDQSRSSPGTTHLSVRDAQGLSISLTASIETAFGSKRMAGGFLLNNQLTDFSFQPVGPDGAPVANAPGPGKRPRSSMAPTIVFEGDDPVLLIGSPGGSRIPEYVANALIAILDDDADPAAAAARPHVSHRNRGTVTLEEGGHSAGMVQALTAMGHQVEIGVMTSGLHILQIGPDGRLRGGADPRREGMAMGD